MAGKNTTTQNLNALAYKATGINNSQSRIGDAMTALYNGIAQWGPLAIIDMKTGIVDGKLTEDTYVQYMNTKEVNTAGYFISIYG